MMECDLVRTFIALCADTDADIVEAFFQRLLFPGEQHVMMMFLEGGL
jgi:hypothetical protein